MFGRFTFFFRLFDRSKRAKPRLWPCKGVMEPGSPLSEPARLSRLSSLNES
jgi:hypothetical protein